MTAFGHSNNILYNVTIEFSESEMVVEINGNQSVDIRLFGNLTYQSKDPTPQDVYLYSNAENELEPFVNPTVMTFTLEGSGEFYVDCHVPSDINDSEFHISVVSVIYYGVIINNMYVVSDRVNIILNRTDVNNKDYDKNPDSKQDTNNGNQEENNIWVPSSILIFVIIIVICLLYVRKASRG